MAVKNYDSAMESAMTFGLLLRNFRVIVANGNRLRLLFVQNSMIAASYGDALKATKLRYLNSYSHVLLSSYCSSYYGLSSKISRSCFTVATRSSNLNLIEHVLHGTPQTLTQLIAWHQMPQADKNHPSLSKLRRNRIILS